jgi:DNA-binding MurR/RpiR family transcriptional regulator
MIMPLSKLSAHSSINERISKVYGKLSKSHKKAADYVISNSFRAATMSIEELAQAAEISIATANRFAHALGFDGYPQFRAGLVKGFEPIMAPIDSLRDEVSRPASCVEIFSRSLQEDARNIELTRQNLDPVACQKAVDMILAADRIFILGYGASSFLSALMGHSLAPFCNTVQNNHGSGGTVHVARQIFRYSSKDLVIAISFPRYARDIFTLLEQIKEHNIPILGLTDTPSSPLASRADVCLYAHTKRHFSPNSEATVLALIEAICAAVSHQAKAPVNSATELTTFLLPWLHKETTPTQEEQKDFDEKRKSAKRA